MTAEAEAKQGARPFVAPGYALRKVPFDAPYSWLAAGWRDMRRVPRVSLAYGAIFAVAGVLLSFGLTAGRPAIADPCARGAASFSSAP